MTGSKVLPDNKQHKVVVGAEAHQMHADHNRATTPNHLPTDGDEENENHGKKQINKMKTNRLVMVSICHFDFNKNY